jgi:divalent metal cation (Fe/Co/Zn/Cd) transporter
VKKAALAVEGVRECHEVRTRGTRDAIFADLRIHVDGGMPLAQAHELGHRVEERLKAAFPGLRDVVIHLEPDDPTHE